MILFLFWPFVFQCASFPFLLCVHFLFPLCWVHSSICVIEGGFVYHSSVVITPCLVDRCRRCVLVFHHVVFAGVTWGWGGGARPGLIFFAAEAVVQILFEKLVVVDFLLGG